MIHPAFRFSTENRSGFVALSLGIATVRRIVGVLFDCDGEVGGLHIYAAKQTVWIFISCTLASMIL